MTHSSFPDFDPGFQAALERLAIAPRRPARNQHAGDARSRQRGRAIEFADYRPYSPGDDPRLVDWRAYSRLGRLYLKQYEEERSRTLTLLVDTSASLHWGDGESHKGLYARRLAAALAWVALSRHEAVQVHLLAAGSSSPLPAVFTRDGAMPLFRRLAGVQEGGKTALALAVKAALAGLAEGPTFLITDLLDPDWAEALEALAATGEGTLLQLLAPEEWEPPLGEEVELEDAESGELRPTRLGPVELATYRARLQQFLEDVRRRCSRLEIQHLALNSGTPLQETLLRQLPAAGVLR